MFFNCCVCKGHRRRREQDTEPETNPCTLGERRDPSDSVNVMELGLFLSVLCFCKKRVSETEREKISSHVIVRKVNQR